MMPAFRARVSDDDILPTLIFIVMAGLACVVPAQNDTFLHLRSGMQMWQTGSFLLTEPFSHTAYGAELHNHWWLVQLLFYGVYALGGPFLLTAFAGACALTAVAGSWRLMRGGWELRVGLLAWLVVATAGEWAVRPQVVSLALLILTAHLIVRDRLAWLPLVCAVWANAHGLVIFGVAMSGAVLLEALLWSRSEMKRAAIVAAACLAAPMVSPLGWNYWPQVLSTVSLARELQIQEYQMPLRMADLPFWLFLGALMLVAVLHRHRLRQCERADRILLIGAFALSVAAVTAARNVAFFAVVAGPAFSRLWPQRAEAVSRRRAQPLGTAAAAMCLTAILVGAAAVLLQWRDGGAELGWRPISPATVDAVRHCPDPIFNQMMDGGFLIWALPERRVFVDGRMEAYPARVLRASRQADVYAHYEATFLEYGISCALVATFTPMYDKLLRDPSMTLVSSDADRAVFVRSRPDEGRQ